jgi:L-2-hydroxyglutarate oxidase LhgO
VLVLETGRSDPATINARTVINAAGLGAQTLASGIIGMPVELSRRFISQKETFSRWRDVPHFRGLIYAMPSGGGLGVHLTLDLAGQARFGPDVEWVDRRAYSVDPRRAESFYSSILTYWPDLPGNALFPAYCGIRPKIERPAGPNTDFVIQSERAYGVPGLTNLLESNPLDSRLHLRSQTSSPFWLDRRTARNHRKGNCCE